ncbi:MAG: DUF1499 domain-containing protein [Pseudomonadales bacterium]|nr:DUF1499 domain-containing protein [Pseudomonadales bacterium]
MWQSETLAIRCSFPRNKQRIAVIAFTCLLGGCTSSPPNSLGLINNLNLANCPDKPNCVVSNADDLAHYIDALDHSGDQQTTRDKLVDVISSMEGGTVTLEESVTMKNAKHNSIYIRAEFQSKWFKFVDDTEFLIEKEKIQVCSAARLGRSDFGVNRERLESIRRAFSP